MSAAPEVLPAAWRARVEGRPDGVAVRYFDGALTAADLDARSDALAVGLQGLGVGKALIEGLIDEARAAGASIHLKVLSGSPARRLYERLGFEVEEEEEEAEHFTSMRVTPRALRAAAERRADD